MERETKEVVLKHSGKKVVVKAFLTETENRIFMKNFAGDIKATDGEDPSRADEIIQYKDAVIQAWVVSVDGSTEKINETLLELPAKDYNQVLEFVKSLVEDDQKKTR